MPHIRAHIRQNSQSEAVELMTKLSELDDAFSLENFDGNQKANAKSLLGVIYAMSDYNDEMFLVNDTHDGQFPFGIDQYRV